MRKCIIGIDKAGWYELRVLAVGISARVTIRVVRRQHRLAFDLPHLVFRQAIAAIEWVLPLLDRRRKNSQRGALEKHTIAGIIG